MALLEKQLILKRSTLPGTGKGLFTKKFIPKGSRIVEYKGRICKWSEIGQQEWDNRYVFYITRNRIIDAHTYTKAFARYANDATGTKRIKGIANNAIFVNDHNRIFIEANKNIPAGTEIFVSYGKEYWDTIKTNKK